MKVLITGIIIAVVVFIFAGPVLFLAGPFRARAARIRLLCRTDHEALLNAGREVLSQVHIESDPNIVGVFPVPKHVEIPKTIRKLHPRGLSVAYNGSLVIAMSGAMDHFGVRIYPEGFRSPYPGFCYGDRELLDGL